MSQLLFGFWFFGDISHQGNVDVKIVCANIEVDLTSDRCVYTADSFVSIWNPPVFLKPWPT